MQSPKALSLIIQALYLGLFISLTCSFRAITSIVIVLLLIAGLAKNWTETKTLFNQNLKNTFLYGCVLFFLIHFIALLCTGNKQEGWLDLQVRIGMVLTPLAVCCTNFINEAKRKKLSHYFIVIVAAVALYCLGVALWKFYQSGDVSFFFYHLLVEPVNGHAGYYSVLVFIALLFLTEVQTRDDFKIRFLYVALIIFLSIFLFSFVQTRNWVLFPVPGRLFHGSYKKQLRQAFFVHWFIAASYFGKYYRFRQQPIRSAGGFLIS